MAMGGNQHLLSENDMRMKFRVEDSNGKKKKTMRKGPWEAPFQEGNKALPGMETQSTKLTKACHPDLLERWK